ncbi:MAG: glycosyltransferase [Candidatus Schekmanbacteria bacterium]|nr:glycosyltransferase [Candidatus Schekmanbacteria bacterium]
MSTFTTASRALPRVLTFNWHETYLHMLGWLGFPMDIVLRMKGGSERWWTEFRPVPASARIVSWPEAEAELQCSRYDLAICHNSADVFSLQPHALPKVLVLHNFPATELGLGGQPFPVEEYRARMRALIGQSGVARLVLISHAKQAAWQLPGIVIPPGINADEYGGYSGEDARVLRVGNLIAERDLMMGFSEQERILAGIPNVLLGLNPRLPGCRPSRSWDDLRDHFRKLRVYLSTLRDGAEDGYNLAMLEAMATGMPVVAMHNRTCPIADGVDGYQCGTVEEARGRVLELLADADLAHAVGKRGRERALETFAKSRFVEQWQGVVREALAAGGAVRQRSDVKDMTMQRDTDRLKRAQGNSTGDSVGGAAPIAAQIPQWVRRVLHVGCADGLLGAALKERGVMEVVGIEHDPERCGAAHERLDRVLVGDVDTLEIPYGRGYFDCIILQGVLEFHRQPEALLAKLGALLWDKGLIVAAVANAQHADAVADLVAGRRRREPEPAASLTRDDLEELFGAAGFAATLQGDAADAGEVFAQATRDGSLRLGRLQFHDLSERDVESLLSRHWHVSAVKAGRDRGPVPKPRPAAPAAPIEPPAAMEPAVSAVAPAPAPLPAGAESTDAEIAAAWAVGDRSVALELARQAWRAGPTGPRQARLAGYLLEMGRVEECRPLLDEIRARYPALLDREAYARCLARQGEHKEALAQLAPVLAAPPAGREADILVLKGDILARAHEYEAALSAYAGAVAVTPEHVGARIGQGTVYVLLNRWAEARDTFETLLAKDEKNVKALVGMGLARRGGGDLQGSWAVLAQAVELDVENETALQQLVEVGTALERFVDLVKPLSAYVDRHPGQVHFAFALAGAHYRLGAEQAVLELCDRILTLDPAHQGARELLDLLARSRSGAAATPPEASVVASSDEHDTTPLRLLRKADEAFPILFASASAPVSPHWYLERSLRRSNPVFTLGPLVPFPLLKKWQMDVPEVLTHYRPHDLHLPFNTSYREIRKRIPERFEKAPLLWVESSPTFFLTDVRDHPGLTACYLIDTHLEHPWHKDYPLQFDILLVAQKEHVQRFRDLGHPNVRWMPLACDPEFHTVAAQVRDIDVAFPMGLDSNQRSRDVLESLQKRFEVATKRAYLRELGQLLARSKIVVSLSLQRDVSSRVFEALASGALVLTDSAVAGGGQELFRSAEYLVTLESDTATPDQVEHYLRDAAARLEIATRGQQLVLDRHTYSHRSQWLLQLIGGEDPGTPWCLDAPPRA